MAKFQRKPPVFDALQFTGGTANAKSIVEGVATLAPNYIVRYQPVSSEYGLMSGTVQEFKSTERLKIESPDGTVWYANLTDWVMVSREKDVAVLTNADFTAQFQPA